jgi:peroxiredoxin
MLKISNFIELNKLLQEVNATFDSLKSEMNAAMYSGKIDSTKMDSLNAVYEKSFMGTYDRFAPSLVKKVESFPGTIANFSAFNGINIEKYLSTYEKVYEALKQKFPQSIYTNQLAGSIEQYKKQFELDETQNKLLPDGGIMPDIKLADQNGKEFALSSLKGKVVLIDFWASWCGPCRKENPNVVKMYSKYNKKGFEIFSVSLDEDKEKWIKAIEKDGLKWKHVSDLKGWNSSVCSQFNISAIPFTILIDKEGKIIKKGLRGEALEQKLEEIF